MKKIILLLIVTCSFAVSSMAQDLDKAKLFFKQSENSSKEFYESILNESNKTFSFDGIKFSQGRYSFKFFDESTRGTDNPRYIYFYTNKYNTGNKDLEIDGVDLYTLSLAEGKFLDFANWWIKYINPKETLESLSSKGKDKFIFTDDDGKNQTLQLLKQDNRWIIRGY